MEMPIVKWAAEGAGKGEGHRGNERISKRIVSERRVFRDVLAYVSCREYGKLLKKEIDKFFPTDVYSAKCTGKP